MSIAFADWPIQAWHDLIAMNCGEPLGEGIGRHVFVYGLDPSMVIKVEMASHSFQNIIEWETWNQAQGTKSEPWLAPCRRISPCGIFLIQDRVEPLRPEFEDTPVPRFLTDFKRSNYGILNGRLVCCDYGTNLLLNHGSVSPRFKKPEWWG